MRAKRSSCPRISLTRFTVRKSSKCSSWSHTDEQTKLRIVPSAEKMPVEIPAFLLLLILYLVVFCPCLYIFFSFHDIKKSLPTDHFESISAAMCCSFSRYSANAGDESMFFKSILHFVSGCVYPSGIGLPMSGETVSSGSICRCIMKIIFLTYG